jgi:hypothetical protein
VVKLAHVEDFHGLTSLRDPRSRLEITQRLRARACTARHKKLL